MRSNRSGDDEWNVSPAVQLAANGAGFARRSAP
jgi:hypothetical protein